jgi:hypothetical protein
MYMFVVMLYGTALLAAEGIFGNAFVVQHLMDQARIQKSLQRPVHRHAVKMITDARLQIGVRQREIPLQKQIQHFFPARRVAQFVILQYIFDGQFHKALFWRGTLLKFTISCSENRQEM